MKYLIELEGERQCVTSLDGYDDWTVVGQSELEDPIDALIELEAIPVNDVEAMAIAAIDSAAEETSEQIITQFRRQCMILNLWEELQRLKLANAITGYMAGIDINERRKQFPGLMALVALSGNTITQVAAAVDNRLWERVRTIHLAHAKLMLAHDAVKAATTAAAKKAAADAVDWEAN